MKDPDDNWVLWRFRNRHEPLGPFGESLWANIIDSCGLYYVQLSTLPALNHKGPRLQGSDAILPDFDVSGRMNAFVDSKAKSQPVEFRLAHELRHGIDRKCYESYSAVAGIQRRKCALAIVEIFKQNGNAWSGALLIQTLHALGGSVNGFSDQEHMCYWPRKRFVEIGSIDPAPLWRMAHCGEKPPESVIDGVNEVLKRQPDPQIQARMF